MPGVSPGLVAAIAAVIALHGATAQEQLPRFKSGVNVVQIDVRVLDRDGRPLRGLTAADFTLLEDGRPHPLVAFSEVVIPQYAVSPRGWLRDVAPDVRNNQLPDGRLLVVVIDDGMLPFDPAMVQHTKEIARGIIDRMGPGDLASVVFTRDGRNAQDFTADRSRLFTAIDRTTAGFIFSQTKEQNALLKVDSEIHYYQASVATLRMVAEALQAAPHKPKTIAYISIGVPFDAEGTAPRLIGSGPMSDATAHQSLRDRMRELFQRSAGSPPVIYAFDPSGFDGLASYAQARSTVKIPRSELFRNFLHDVSNNSGGRATLDTNDWNPGLERMFRETSAYYLLAYEPANATADGTFRRLDIKVTRPGAQVLARNGYFAPKVDKAPPREPSTANAAVAIGQVLPQGGLPMQAMAVPFAGRGKKAAVAIVAGLRHPVPAGASAESVDMVVNAFTPDGRAKASQRQTVRLRLRQSTDGEARYEILTRLDLDPGRYHLRLGAQSTLAADTGSIYLDVDVPDFSKEGLSASGVVLTSPSAPMAAPPTALSGLVPTVPTTLRHFTRTDRVSGFMRLYQGGKTPLAPVLVATRLVDETGATVSQGRIDLAIDRFVGRAADVPLDLPIADLAPGRYLFDISLEAVGSNPQRQTRQIRFVVEK